METPTSVSHRKHTFRNDLFVFIKIIALSFLIGACDSNGPESDPTTDNSSDLTSDSSSAGSFMDSVTIEKHHYLSDEGSLKIRIEYPEIKGLKDTALQSQLNTRLNEVFLGAIKSDGDDLEGEGEVETTYTVQYSNKGVLSVAFSTYEFYSEANHPWKNYFSLTINLKTGKDILLENLLINNYKEKISSAIQLQEDALNKSGTLFTAANKDDLSVFCIANDGLIFYLQGSSKAEGTQEFKIPFESLKENIHPDYAGLLF